MRRFLIREAALLVYKNMIRPIVEYGDIFLSVDTLENRRKCQVVQNRALRIVHKVDKLYRSDLIHEESKLLKLRYRREQHLLHFMHSRRNDPSLRKLRRESGVTTRVLHTWVPSCGITSL